MCLKPVLIPNVNYGNTSSLARIKDTTSKYIPVPCGRCSVCLQLKQQYMLQRVQMEALDHDFYYGTLTYNNESLPFVERGEFVLNYPDISDWQKMIKRIRRYEKLPDFKYLLVSEYGGRRHRPHFHFILSFPKNDRDTLADRWSFGLKLHDIFLSYWKRNIALPIWSEKRQKFIPNSWRPVWQPLCTYKRTFQSYNFDLHYCDPWSSKNGINDVAFYVSKYVLKYDKWVDKLKSKLFFNLSESDFNDVWSLIRPRRLMSKGFGSPDSSIVAEHISKGIDLAIADQSAKYPYFISPVDGSTYPLAPYFAARFMRIPDLELFHLRNPSLTGTDRMLDSTPDYTIEEIVEKERKFGVVRDYLNARHTYEDDSYNLFNNFELYSNEISIQDLSRCADDFSCDDF